MLVQCPACGWQRDIGEELTGRRGRCGNCKTEFVLEPAVEIPVVMWTRPPLKKSVLGFGDDRWNFAIVVGVLLLAFALGIGVGLFAGKSLIIAARKEATALRKSMVADQKFLHVTRDQLRDAITEAFPEYRTNEKIENGPGGETLWTLEVGSDFLTTTEEDGRILSLRVVTSTATGDERRAFVLLLTVVSCCDSIWDRSESSDWLARAMDAVVSENVLVYLNRSLASYRLGAAGNHADAMIVMTILSF